MQYNLHIGEHRTNDVIIFLGVLLATANENIEWGNNNRSFMYRRSIRFIILCILTCVRWMSRKCICNTWTSKDAKWTKAKREHTVNKFGSTWEMIINIQSNLVHQALFGVWLDIFMTLQPQVVWSWKSWTFVVYLTNFSQLFRKRITHFIATKSVLTACLTYILCLAQS